jgi:hypothetical protein
MMRNGARLGELGTVASTVIARRMALSMAGDHSEVPAMVPEKLAAFGAAGAALLHGSAAIGGVVGRYAMAEAAEGAATAMKLAQCHDPASLMLAHSQSVGAAWGRWLSFMAEMGAGMAIGTSAAMRPVHRAARRNAKRLG